MARNYLVSPPAFLHRDKSFYRLQIKEKDGKAGYSNIIELNRSQAAEMIRLFPNPVTAKMLVSVVLQADKELAYRVSDMSGRQVLAGSFKAKKGENQFSLDLSGLAKGQYLFKMAGESLQFLKQ